MSRLLRGLLGWLVVVCLLPWDSLAQGGARFPLEVAADGRHLVGQTAEPFLLNGDAAWSLMVELTQAEVEAYLEDRRQKGFNAVLVNLIERGFGGPANAEGELPFEPANDYDSPNPDYFAHVDWVIAKAAEKGMLVLLTPSYLGFNCGSQGWCAQMLDEPVASMTAYGRFLGNRYRTATNVLWVHGGDTDAADHGALSRVNAIANGIRERAPGHLHTAHCSRHRSGIECYDEPWLDVNTAYSSCPNTLGDVRDEYARAPAIPFFYIEGTYENEGASLGCLIDQAAWAVVGGGFGHVMGNDPIWNFGTGWEGQLSSPGSRAMERLAGLFLAHDWFRLEPDRTGAVLVSGAGNDAAAARSGDRKTVLVHVPTARALSVDLGALSGDTVHARWFDPSSGSTTEIGEFPPTGVVPFDAPGRRILLLEAGTRAPPGGEPGPSAFCPAEVPAIEGAGGVAEQLFEAALSSAEGGTPRSCSKACAFALAGCMQITAALRACETRSNQAEDRLEAVSCTLLQPGAEMRECNLARQRAAADLRAILKDESQGAQDTCRGLAGSCRAACNP